MLTEMLAVIWGQIPDPTSREQNHSTFPRSWSTAITPLDKRLGAGMFTPGRLVEFGT